MAQNNKVESFSGDDKETVITHQFSDKDVVLYTNEPYFMLRLNKLVAENENYKAKVVTTNTRGEPIAMEYTFPKKYLRFARKERVLSDEQRQAASERLKKLRGSQKKGN